MTLQIPENITAIIFDVGGVLHANGIEHVYADIMQYFGLTREEFLKAYKPLIARMGKGTLDETEFWKLFRQEIGNNKELPSGESLFTRAFNNHFQKHEDMLEQVKLLKDKGYKLAILSNSIAPHYEHLLDKGVFDDFDIKVFSHQVGMRKPDAEIYKYTLSLLETTPQETLFIDDLEKNTEAAEQLGINTVLYISD